MMNNGFCEIFFCWNAELYYHSKMWKIFIKLFCCGENAFGAFIETSAELKMTLLEINVVDSSVLNKQFLHKLNLNLQNNSWKSQQLQIPLASLSYQEEKNFPM